MSAKGLALIVFSAALIFPLQHRSSPPCLPTTNARRPPCEVLVPHLQMVKMRAWSFFFFFFWPVEIWHGTGGGNWRWMARAHAIAMATVWSFSWWLSGLQCTRWRSGQVDDRGKVNRIGSLSLVLSLSLPSADPESSFDWISHELMRQAWRKASVVEISYHILICSLCEWCMRLCDPMLFLKLN